MTTVLRAALQARGYPVRTVATGTEALNAVADDAPALVVLDLALPDIDGVEVCRRIRSWSDVAIIVVTADGAEDRKVAAFDAGADDYVTKPFSMRELLARINAVIRRSRGEAAEPSVPEREELGNFRIDRPARRVIVDGAEIRLTAREFELISYMVGHPGRVHSREALIQRVWGVDFMGDRKTVDVHVRWLREKFANRVPFEIVTVRGAGYRLDRFATEPAEALA